MVRNDLSAEFPLISFISDSCCSEQTPFLEHFLHTLSIFTQAVAKAPSSMIYSCPLRLWFETDKVTNRARGRETLRADEGVAE